MENKSINFFYNSFLNNITNGNESQIQTLCVISFCLYMLLMSTNACLSFPCIWNRVYTLILRFFYQNFRIFITLLI